MELKPKQMRQIETERKRGWILYLLYAARPKTIVVATLQSLLDSRNLPFTSRRLAEEMDYLRSLGLLRVWRMGGKTDLSYDEQEELINRFCDSDGEMDDSLCVRVTNKGINFQEGQFEEQGVTRVN